MTSATSASEQPQDLSTAQRPARSTLVVQGGAAFGNLFRPTSAAEVQQAIEAAWDLGVRRFDTAPHYGVGLSEERMGKFLSQQSRDDFSVSTKVGRLLVEDPQAPTESEAYVQTPRRRRVRDYSPGGVRRSLEDSLTRMGLDRIDLVLIHDPEDYLDEAVEQAAPALSALRAEGVIGGYGVGTNFSEVALRLVNETDLDTVMIAGRYTLLDRGAEAALLPACAARGVNVLTAGVFNSGLLADPQAADAHYDYDRAPAEIVATAQRLQATCRQFGIDLKAAALQFPIRHPAVAAVVLGAATAAEVRDSCEELEQEIPEELWVELERMTG